MFATVCLDTEFTVQMHLLQLNVLCAGVEDTVYGAKGRSNDL